MIITTDKLKQITFDISINYQKRQDKNCGLFETPLADVRAVVSDLELKDSQIDKPYLKIWEKEKVMSVACNDELWKFVNSLEGLNEKNFTLGKFSKIYMELK